MDNDIVVDDKNMIVMKLLHYFITEKNYNPIILQGVENEIWLENLDADYKVVRIVSNYIHNDEQFDFDIFKTRRIMKKIKAKTLSFKMPTLSIFLDLGENVSKDLDSISDIDCIKIDKEKDLDKNKIIKEEFPDLTKNMDFKEDGLALFTKITTDINKHNKKDADRAEALFRSKFPIITIIIISLCVLLYVVPKAFGEYNNIIENFCIYGPYIRQGEYYRLLTGTFLHGNILHLLFNCYALYIIGSQLESFLGKWKYTIIYLFSALAGSLFSMIFTKGASIGASGAIFGLMGSLVYFGYHYRVYLGNVIKTQIIPLIILNLALGFMMAGIDNFAHIGGLIGGTLITIALGVKDKSTTFERVNGWIITLIFLGFSLYMAFIYTA
jgi:membrane associated rhomboid family serine protease